MKRKSTLAAFILALLLGPIGVLYASVLAGAIMILAAVFLLWGASLFSPGGWLIWFISILVSVFSARSHNRRIEAEVKKEQQAEAAEQQEQDRAWQTLLTYDEDARRAADRVKEYGEAALEELRKAYNVIKDPAKLPSIAEQIRANAEKERERLGDLAQYIIPVEKAVEALKAQGIDNPNEPGERANRPLHQAAERGDVELVGLLLSAGAKPYETNMAGFTPVDVARRAGHSEVIELIDSHQESAA